MRADPLVRVLAAVLLGCLALPAAAQTVPGAREVLDKAQSAGTVRVIARIAVPRDANTAEVENAKREFESSMTTRGAVVANQIPETPLTVLEVTAAQLQALVESGQVIQVVEDRIDVLATDHAPHTLEEKQKPYLQAPSGLPLVQYALVSALELVHDERIELTHLVQKLCHAPAQLFDVKDRGHLREGMFADIAIVDPDHAFTAQREDVLSKCGWSPFEGRRFRSSIWQTWVNGECVYRDGALTGVIAGRRMDFDR